MTVQKYVGLIRVSTDKQQKAGNGLADQEQVIRKYVASVGGELIAIKEEVISGRSFYRKICKEALELAREHDATLVVSKLDRLARRVSTIADFIEKKIPFVCAETPHFNEAMLQMMSVFYEMEAKEISKRTKAGMAQAKKKGSLFGANNPSWQKKCDKVKRTKAINEARVKYQREAQRLNKKMVKAARKLVAEGMTYRAIAKELKKQDFKTVKGRHYRPTYISFLINRRYADKD